MHVAFLSPEYPSDQALFLRALKRQGARISGIGSVESRYLPRTLLCLLDDYERVRSVEDEGEVVRAAVRLHRRRRLDRIEAVHEKQVVPAAKARSVVGCPGEDLETVRLSRDKLASKAFLSGLGIPSARCSAAESVVEARSSAEKLGYPLILKRREGFGGLETYRVDDWNLLEGALAKTRPEPGNAIVLESLQTGREGFLDALVVEGQIQHLFLSRYDPGVLDALTAPDRAARITTDPGVDDVRNRPIIDLGRRVIEALKLGTVATHMEFFETEEGPIFSEIGLRPPGERLWELHAAAHDLDLHREWALATCCAGGLAQKSGRFATGSIQVRPVRQGRIAGYRGLTKLVRELRPWILSSQVLTRGYPTTPLEAGYLGNVWFRLFHPDPDELRNMLDRIENELEILVE